MEHPRITIIVPCRNERLHIEAAVSSMLTQEEVAGGFEIVIADGASDDGTRDILDRMAACEPRLEMKKPLLRQSANFWVIRD